MIKNVIFDLGKVLINNDPSEYLRKYGYDEEKYRLMQELNNAFGEGVVGGEKVFKINDKFSITTLNGKFTIMNIASQIIDEVPIENFQKRPRVTFGKIKEMVK